MRKKKITMAKKKKKAINFKSRQAEKNYMKFQHSNPKARAAAARSPGNTPVKVRGKSVKVSHTKKRKKKRK